MSSIVQISQAHTPCSFSRCETSSSFPLMLQRQDLPHPSPHLPTTPLAASSSSSSNSPLPPSLSWPVAMEADWKDHSASPAHCHSILARRKQGDSEHSTKPKKNPSRTASGGQVLVTENNNNKKHIINRLFSFQWFFCIFSLLKCTYFSFHSLNFLFCKLLKHL